MIDFLQGMIPEEILKKLDLSTLTLDNNSYMTLLINSVFIKMSKIKCRFINGLRNRYSSKMSVLGT